MLRVSYQSYTCDASILSSRNDDFEFIALTVLGVCMATPLILLIWFLWLLRLKTLHYVWTKTPQHTPHATPTFKGSACNFRICQI